MRSRTKAKTGAWAAACLLCVANPAKTTAATPQGTAAAAEANCRRYHDFANLTEHELLDRVTHREEPQDDPLLRQADFDTVVVVRVYVNKLGRVVCASLTKPSRGTSGGLDAVSVAVAKRWRFRPLQRGGHAVGMQGDLTFHLKH